MNAYVLVGGESRRMGRSKSMLFLERIASAARPVFGEVIAVARADGRECEGVPTIFETPHDEIAAIYGLQRALQHAAGAKCVVLAVDYPLITSAFLAWLADRFEASNDAMLATEWDGRLQPLCAGYDAAQVGPLVDARIREGRYDLSGLASAAAAAIVREEQLRAIFPGELLMNVNTPEELTRMEKNDE